MVAFSNPGAYFNTGQMLPRYLATAAQLNLIDATATSVASSAGTFWTDMAIRGAAVDTNWSAGVKKQLYSFTGACVLEGIIGPTSAGADTDTFEIVVDGVTWTSAALTGAAAARTCLAFLVPAAFFGTTVTTNFLATPPVSAQNATTGLRNITGNAAYIVSAAAEVLGIPYIRASQSLTVSITHSANLTTTTNQERQAGVIVRPG